jgi:hypothetical protein
MRVCAASSSPSTFKSERKELSGFARDEEGLMGVWHGSGKLKPLTRKRVGLSGFKAPARSHTEIFDADGTKKVSHSIGAVCAACRTALALWVKSF